ncbi:MAG: hypothetical protein KA764_01925 [Anaerolineales bacterium]|nr:hypothetical protein [Anaerolineales bacterium]
MNLNGSLTPAERTRLALEHREPDRVPVDFLATPEIWDRLVAHFQPSTASLAGAEYFSLEREAILRQLQVDCRVISYDMFCRPPERVLRPGAEVDWWNSLSRSTPNRMWRQHLPDGTDFDIWGHHIRIVDNPSGRYEEFASWPLAKCETVADLAQFDWAEPDWWDFRPAPDVIRALDQAGPYHLRFRIGSVFELAWQLRGLQEFMMDLARAPEIPLYIMDRLTDVLVENTRRFLEQAGDRVEMVYLYDDVGGQNSLLISRAMWRKYVRPRHEKLIAVARAFGKKVMYHTDGAVRPLIPEFIDMGVDVLNPLQPNAKDMAPSSIKAEFGDRLAFHGGIDIVDTLRVGTPAEVAAEVQDRVSRLGAGGGYILCSSHHIQADSPLENVLAMYAPELRYRSAA